MPNKIVIAGCHEAGLETALRIKRKVKDEAEVVAVNDDGFFTFRPWLKHVFREKRTSDIAVNLDFVLSENGIRFEKETIEDVDLEKSKLKTGSGTEDFDFLVLSLPEVPDYSVKGAEKNALPYYDAEQAERIREHIRNVISRSDGTEEDLTVAVCGGGARGVELVSELNEFLDRCCEESEVRRIDVKLTLIEKEGMVLPSYPLKARSKAMTHLNREGVDLRTGIPIKEIKKDKIILEDGTEIGAGTIIWCGGTKPNPLFEDHEISTTADGRVIVNRYRQSVTEATVYGAGPSTASQKVKYKGPETKSLGNSVRQAKSVAHNLVSNILEKEKKEFRFLKMPVFISLGRKKAMIVWNGLVMEGRIPNLLSKIREGRYRGRWK